MLKTEFEDRFGKRVTDEQYKDIERLYMASGFIFKDEFVNEFKKLSKAGEVSPLLLNLTNVIEGLRSEADAMRESKTKLGAWLIKTSDRELTASEMDAALRAKALETLEEKEYLRALLEMASPLREADRELMKAHI
jgi:hypothetical protein